jgi:hypothetical protein
VKSLVARDGLGEGEYLMSLGPVGTSLGDPLSCIGLSVVSSTVFCSMTG